MHTCLFHYVIHLQLVVQRIVLRFGDQLVFVVPQNGILRGIHGNKQNIALIFLCHFDCRER